MTTTDIGQDVAASNEAEASIARVLQAVNRNTLHIATRCTDMPLSEAAIARARNRINDALDYISWINTLAGYNRPISRQRNIISLGRDCLARTLPTKFGLIDTKSAGRPRMPFDLAVHPVRSVLLMLRDDFEPYFERSIYDINDSGFPVIRGYGIVFNHEVQPAARPSGSDGSFDIDRLIAKNRARVEAFRSAAAAPDASFLVHVKDDEIWHCAQLLDHLGDAYPHASVFVVGKETPDLLGVCRNRHSDATFISPSYYPGYQWNLVEHFATKTGIEVEREISAALENHVHKAA